MTINYKKDIHFILGVTEKAGPEELRRAYLALAVKYHPDRNLGDPAAEERFKDISQAYAILSDPAARARYQRLRPQTRATTRPARSPAQETAKTKEAPKAKPQGGPPPGSGPPFGASSTPKGSAGSGTRPKEAEAGKTRPRGTGATETGSKPEPDKSGDFDDVLASFFKSERGRETLRDLEGELNRAGVKFKTEDLAGWLKDRKQKPRKKTILARLTNWLLRVTEKSTKLEQAADIHYHISLSSEVAATGTEVDISYQDQHQTTRHLKVKIPAKTRDQTKLRLSGQGGLKADGQPGDLILTVTVGGQSVSELWGGSKK